MILFSTGISVFGPAKVSLSPLRLHVPLRRLRGELADGRRHQEDGGEERNEWEGDNDGDDTLFYDPTGTHKYL